MGFENSVADLFSCETSWLCRCVPTVNMVRVIRNVLRFNTGKILRFPQKSANWPIPIWCFTTLVAPVFQELAENIASILFFHSNVFLYREFLSFFLSFFFIHSKRYSLSNFEWKIISRTFRGTVSINFSPKYIFLSSLKQILKLISPEKGRATDIYSLQAKPIIA